MMPSANSRKVKLPASGRNALAASLAELGPPTSGAASPAAADLIGSDLSGGEKQGYKFTLTGNQAGYVINANPVAFNSSGSRT